MHRAVQRIFVGATPFDQRTARAPEVEAHLFYTEHATGWVVSTLHTLLSLGRSIRAPLARNGGAGQQKRDANDEE